MVGVSTACLYPTETEVAFEFLAENGVKNVEVFFNTDSEFTFPFAQTLKKISRDNGINIYSVHPYTSFGDYYYLYCPYKRRQQDAFDMNCRFFDICSYLGAEVMNFHGPRFEQKVEIEKYCDIYVKLYRLAKQRNICFNQENVCRCHSRSPEFIRKMADICGDEVSFTLDIKQAIRANQSPVEMAKAMNGHMRLVHCSDHDDKSDCLLPFCGTYDFAEFYRTLKGFGYEGMYMIEVYSQSYENKSEIIKSYKELSALFERLV